MARRKILLAVAAVAAVLLPAVAAAQERIADYIIDPVTIYDAKGTVLDRVPAGNMPAIPPGGLKFQPLEKGLLQINIGGKALVLNKAHVKIEGTALADGIGTTCHKVRSKPGEKRASNIGMGLGGC